MKKIFLAIICTLLITLTLFCVTNANAEENATEDVSETEQTEIITDENESQETDQYETEEESSGDKLRNWFNANLGWIFGLPLGAMLTALCEILVLSKKAKETAQSIKNNIDLKNNVKEEINTFKDIVSNAKEVTNYTYDSIKKISTKLGVANANIDKITHSFNTLNDNLGAISNRLNTLEKSICMIAQNDEKLVSNGVSGNITRLLEEQK